MHNKAFGGRVLPEPAGELTAVPDSLAGFRGGTSPEGEGGRWKGRERGERVRREGKKGHSHFCKQITVTVTDHVDEWNVDEDAGSKREHPRRRGPVQSSEDDAKTHAGESQYWRHHVVHDRLLHRHARAQ